MRIGIGCIAAIVALASAPPASAKTQPYFGETTLISGFPDDPHEVGVLPGGDVPVDNLGPGCVGFVSSRPDYRVQFETDGVLPFILRTRSEADTVLVVEDPYGDYHCDDDGYDGLNAEVRFDRPVSGPYTIWVGTYVSGLETIDATLSITELDDEDGMPALAGTTPGNARRGTGTGTGFFINGDGDVVTNAHVVDGCTSVTVRSGASREDEGAVVAHVDEDVDLAVIATNLSSRHTASIRPGVRLGEGIAIFGFPLTQMLARSGNFTLGHVTALSGFRDDDSQIQISAPVQAGNSGGPVLDLSGNLVGVVVAKLDGLVAAMSTGDLPQNVNFAVNAGSLESFLDRNRVAYKVGDATDRYESADLADVAKNMSVFIQCRS